MSEWISVEDRLPEGPTPVLCVWMGQTQDVCFVCNNGSWYGYDPFNEDDGYKGECADPHVTHWMPLPEPPS